MSIESEAENENEEAGAGVPESPAEPEVVEPPPDDEPKKKSRLGSLNLFTRFSKLSQRMQVIVFIVIVIGLSLVLLKPPAKKKSGSSPVAPPTMMQAQDDGASTSTDRSATGAGEAADSEYQDKASVPDRSYVVPPTIKELAAAGKTVPRAAVPGVTRNVSSAHDVPVYRSSRRAGSGEVAADSDSGSADSDSAGGSSTVGGGGGGEYGSGGEYADGSPGGGRSGSIARLAGVPSASSATRRSHGVEILGMGAGLAGPTMSSAKSVNTNAGNASGGGTPLSAPAHRVSAQKLLEKEFAPIGRLLKCKLVNTIDSNTPSTAPVLAMVTEDLNFNGKVIVPAGTEILSYISEKPKLDANGIGRLFDNGIWTLVLPGQGTRINGREWVIRGRVLDRRENIIESDGRVRSWGMDDLSPGFIGYTISTLDNEEIKLFISSFLGQSAAALGETLQERQVVEGTENATQSKPTISNAALASMSAGAIGVMNAMAERIKAEIAERGFYVRIPSGKEFYVFVEETLDPRNASVGASRKVAKSE
jgi:hypothetical protein